MAKLKNPLLGFHIRGSLSKAISFRGRGRQTIAEKIPQPQDPKSLAQLSWRHMYQKAAALWHLLSPDEKADWESNARIRHMTGFAWFMSQCLKPNPGIYLPLQGGIMQGDINMADHKITDLPTPALDHEAATKKYVDDGGGAGPHATTHETGGADEVNIAALAGEPAELTTHKALSTGVHGLAALHAAGFHSAGQSVNKIIWKDTFVTLLDINIQTADIPWTQLDLTAATSPYAKFAIVLLRIRGRGVAVSGISHIDVRKNGTTSSIAQWLRVGGYDQYEWHFDQVIIALDSAQVIEYALTTANSDSVDADIILMGYIE